jgi:hypothetical protein
LLEKLLEISLISIFLLVLQFCPGNKPTDVGFL